MGIESPKFDFSKAEDQKKFNAMSDKEQSGIKNETHEDANMMRVIASGEARSYEGFKKPKSKEEINGAFEALEELKQMVKNEPLTEKIFGQLARISVISRDVMNDAINDIATLNKERSNEEFSNHIEQMLSKRQEALRSIEYSSSKLKALKDDANDFGFTEKIQHKE